MNTEAVTPPSGINIFSSFPPGVFMRYEPAIGSTPVVVDVSRSGHRYPVDFRPDAPFSAVHTKISMYVDELLSYAPEAGATLLVAEFPITVIDTNRLPDDVDPAIVDGTLSFTPNPTDRSLKNGAGLIHTLGAGRVPLYEGKLSAAQIMARIQRYYDPYHAELKRLLEKAKEGQNKAYHLSFHCMSSIDPKNPDGADARRPDICLGDLNGQTCGTEFREIVAEYFGKQGYEVAINSPFKGGQLIERYGKPEAGTESLQVELCKRLFMNEANGERSEKFCELQRQLGEVVRQVCEYSKR